MRDKDTMDQRKAVRKDHFRLQPTERRFQVATRSVNQDARMGASPMARPAAGSPFSSSPVVSPLAESLARTHREMRVRREKALLLCGLAVLALSASFIALLLTKLSSSQPSLPTPVVVQTNNQASLANNQNAAVSLPMPAGQTKILLLGSDQRPDDNGYRTDTIILLTLDPQKMTVSAVSFPRDLWVKVPSLYEMKINQVFGLGGFDAMAGMFQANFGVTPDYYVLTNFAGFTRFIDNQGGVDVAVGQELTDACDLPQARNGNCTVEPGTVHMDGATALWYVRSRYTSSDFDRLRRAQEVLYGLFKKMVSLASVTKLSEIKTALADNVETNISIAKALSFLPLASDVLQSPDHIQRFAITEDQATPFWSWNGEWILLPDTDAIHSLLQQAGVQP
jgi:LCP family protein required for cell wall assembly